ncbi:MAG: 4-hydroxy-tetrahydrodipicolinate synthase [Calditrichia bacterium]
MFGGSIVALVTPFDKKNRVNYSKIKELVEFHLKEGTDAVLPCGTTGEAPTLEDAEKLKIFETAVKAADKQIPVIAGTGSYNTAHTIELTKRAKKIGVTAVLIVAPYYNKPTQEGLYRHYMAVADEGGLPVVIYNIPGRTGVNIMPDTLARLAEHPRIVAVKEASGNLGQISEIQRRLGDKLAVLSGDDGLTLPILAVGGKGVISVTANIVPARVKEMIQAFMAGDRVRALELHQRLEDLNQALFLETNPIPIKTAMNLMGFEVGGFRLPLCEMSERNRERLKAVLQSYQLIPGEG